MYQITLSLKERQELVQALQEKIEEKEQQIASGIYGENSLFMATMQESIAHLENIKLKVQAAKIMPIKGLEK